MKEISPSLFLLPLIFVIDNVVAVIELLRTRPEAEVGLSCGRLYLRPQFHLREFLTAFPCIIVYYCLPFPSLDGDEEGSTTVFHGAFIFHCFSWQAEHKSKCFLCEKGVCAFLLEVLASVKTWGIWGFDKALKETSKLSGISLSTSHSGTEGI